MLRAKNYSIKYGFVSLGKRASNGCVFSVLSFNGLALSPNVYSLLLDNPPTCGSWHAVRRYVCVQVCLSPWKQWVVFIPFLVHCQQHDLSRYKMRKFVLGSLHVKLVIWVESLLIATACIISAMYYTVAFTSQS